jgi:hypothetical protein
MSVERMNESVASDDVTSGGGRSAALPGLPRLTNTDSRIEKIYDRYMREQKAAVPAYGLVYFGQMDAEYLSIRSGIKDQEALKLLDGIHERAEKRDPPLTWNDVYAFDLELSKFLSPESLLHKARELRDKYRRAVGLRDYDAYMATRPPDLEAIRLPAAASAAGTSATAPASSATLDAAVEAALREDVKYLMSRVYLEYALAPLREGVRAELTRKGVRWTLSFVTFLAAFVIISTASASFPSLRILYALTRVSTIGVVVVAGIVGGLVSMLQRIQATPSDGDVLYGLASLSNGWRGIFLAPLKGAIFSSLLFILFAGGILKGAIFPEIRSTGKSEVSVPTTTQWAPVSTPTELGRSEASHEVGRDSAAQSPATATPTPTASPAVSGATSVTPSGGQTPSAKTSANKSNAAPTATPRVVTSSGVNSVPFSNFLRDTGPASGADFALLIIWSFIAGFAERLVPDTLHRLVAKAAPPDS